MERASLILEDGTTMEGRVFGARASVSGEVVFSTGMIGYPESLTDPSYRGQILVMTYPLIGNYGVPGNGLEDGLLRYFESERVQVQGLVVSDYSERYAHWNAASSLSDWMRMHGVPGITGIDTRALTKRLRERGTMLGKIVVGEEVQFQDPNRRNLAREVSVQAPVTYQRGKKRVLVVDCGVKNSIIRAFLRRGITVTRVPWDDELEGVADGIVLSNGPGDPALCRETIASVRGAMEREVPILGICLGSQILGLAAGARTYKLKYGHRGHNQPCVETGTKRCYITPQNHGYAVDAASLPEDWREWFYNSNDGTNEGLKHISKPFFGAQFHPEGSPGPDDTEFLFDIFVRGLRK
ncbi:MAG: glutamine-hydrolyzing carbamoyl-phosphate synthase small subunit [Candidatus Thermoplasmatota archaeon]